MNISELLQSTSYLSNYRPSETFGRKQFGSIYLYNKNVRVKPRLSVIEVSMMIGGVTDKVRVRGETRAVAAHKVMVSIGSVNQETISRKDLVEKIRKERTGYEDKEKYADDEIIRRVLNGNRFFEDKTIFPASPTDTTTFVLVDNNISKESMIRVWCSCSSYYWTFQYYNVENGVDIWMKYPEEYIPKTKKGFEAFKQNRPLRNPGRHPGMCKHIMLLLALLMDQDTIAEARSVVRSYRANLDRFIDKKVSRISGKEYEKLMKKYRNDHRRKLNQRKLNRSTLGEAPYSANKRGWNRKFDWKTGTWKKRRG